MDGSNNIFDLVQQKAVPLNSSQRSSESLRKTEEVTLSENLFERYRAARRKWEKQSQEDLDFKNGAQWTKAQERELKRRGQIPFVVNLILPAVETAKAILTANRPRFSATAREDSDVKVAKAMENLMSYIWDHSNGSVELKKAVEDYLVRGIGWLMAYVDPYGDFNRGEVCIANVDPLDVYVDPNSKDIYCRDAAHIILSRIMTAEQVQQWYPGAMSFLRMATPEMSNDIQASGRISYEDVAYDEQAHAQSTDHVKFRIIDRYSRVKVQYFHVYDTSQDRELVLSQDEYSEYVQLEGVALVSAIAETKYVTNQIEVEKYREIVRQAGPVIHFEQVGAEQDSPPQVASGPESLNPNAIRGSQVTIQFVPYMKLIELGILVVRNVWLNRIRRVLSIGGVEVFNQLLEVDSYPMVPIMAIHHRNPYPNSFVRSVRGIQEYVNKVRSLIVAHASNLAGLKLIAPRGSVNKQKLEEDWGKVGAVVVEVDDETGKGVTVASPPPLPGDFYRIEATAKAEIEQIFGIYSVMQGDPNNSPETFKGTMAIDEFGQRRSKSQREDVEGALNQLARIVVQMIQKTYTREKIIRVIQPSGPPVETVINQSIYDEYSGEVIERVNDVTTGMYDVVVVSGSTLPSNRWAQFDYFVRLYQLGVIDQVELLKKAEVFDIEGVLNRSSQMAALMQENEALKKEIKRLSGDLQTAQRESVHDRKRVEVEKFKSQLKDAATTAKKAVKLFETRLEDELRNLRRRKQGSSELSLEGVTPGEEEMMSGIPGEDSVGEVVKQILGGPTGAVPAEGENLDEYAEE